MKVWPVEEEADWRDLSEEEWREHPLNRVRGWMALIVFGSFINLFFLPLFILLMASLRGNSFEIAWWDNWDRLNGALFWVHVVAYFSRSVIAGVFIYSVLIRYRWLPTINKAFAIWAVSFELSIGVGAYAGILPFKWDFEDLMWTFLLESIIWHYLINGERPNVMFRRRVRTPT